MTNDISIAAFRSGKHWNDSHDAALRAVAVEGAWRTLQPGMAYTVEAGCYIRAANDVPQAFWNIGIRIEDNVVISEQGCEVLTEAAPTQSNPDPS